MEEQLRCSLCLFPCDEVLLLCFLKVDSLQHVITRNAIYVKLTKKYEILK